MITAHRRFCFWWRQSVVFRRPCSMLWDRCLVYLVCLSCLWRWCIVAKRLDGSRCHLLWR